MNDPTIVTISLGMTGIISTGIVILKLVSWRNNNSKGKSESKNSVDVEIVNKKITGRLEEWRKNFCDPAHKRFDDDVKNLGTQIRESESRMKESIGEVKRDLTDRIESMESTIITAIGKK